MLLIGLAALILYAATGVPGPFDGDYGEFQYMPRLLGLPHPTGYPLYLLLGWFWSWLPLGTMALRMNLLSAVWAALTLALLVGLVRQQGISRTAALAGAVTLGIVPAFWQYAGLAAVYTLHTALLAAALWLWLAWARALRSREPTARRLWLAAFATGLCLTNHPTAAFIVPAALLFVLAHWMPLPRLSPHQRPTLREVAGAALAFALPGLLYLYVPLRLWGIGPGETRAGLHASIAKGWIAPFLEWNTEGVLHYITGRSLLGGYEVAWELLVTRLPGLLVEQAGLPLVALGMLGAALWFWQKPRGWLLGTALFLPAAAYAVTYDAEFASRNQIAHLEGHLLPALLVLALWVAAGVEGLVRAGTRLLRRGILAEGGAALLLALVVFLQLRGAKVPTTADRVQSQSIRTYWTEVLAYPLEEEAALTGHWGDLTAFWYFQHGEGMRPDLWAIFPPNRPQIEAWLEEAERPVYLAGPLLDWGSDITEEYELTPWGILVRVAPRGNPPTFPPMQPREVLFGEQLRLDGYRTETLGPTRRQLWLAWETTTPTSRDLSVSVRLHGPDGAQLLQKDGRLASLWLPDGTMPADQPLLTVFDLDLPPDLPAGTVVRIVVYDPNSLAPLLTSEGQDVVELGLLGGE